MQLADRCTLALRGSIDAELPVLQPVEGERLPLLEPVADEPVDEGPVKCE